jgi:hypothetical protein
MKIFVVYDSTGYVWYRAHTSFQAAIDVVTLFMEEENRRRAICDEDCDSPAKMETEFTYKDEQGGVMVAFNEVDKISTFVKELNI